MLRLLHACRRGYRLLVGRLGIVLSLLVAAVSGASCSADVGAEDEVYLQTFFGKRGDSRAVGEDLANQTSICMKKRGYEYIGLETTEQRVRRSDPTEWILPPSSSFRSAWGYGWTVDDSLRLAASQRQAQKIRVLSAGDEAAISAYHETEVECFAAAAKTLTAHGEIAASEEMFARAESAFEIFFSKLHDDEEIVEAEKAWSKCMLSSGNADAESPQAFRRRLSEQLAERVFDLLGDENNVALQGSDRDVLAAVAQIQSDEVKAAEADARCQSTSTLLVSEKYHSIAREVFGDLSPR